MKFYKLKVLMSKKGFTQASLDAAIGSHAATVSHHLNALRKMPEKYIPKLCKELGITREEHDNAYGVEL